MKTKTILSVLCLLSAYCLLCTAYCFSAVPPLINYQGVLTKAPGVPQNGEFTMQFSIHSDSSGGDLLWNETQDSVQVTRGLFSVLLGSVNPIPASIFEEPNRWLEVEVEGSVLSPRRQIVSVGYAFHSGFTDTAEYALSAPRDDDWTPDTAGFNIYRLTGGVGIGTPSPQYKLDVAGTGQMTGFKMPTTASDGYVLTSDAAGVGTWQTPPAWIGGSGTANYLPKFTDATTLGNSIIYEAADNVGIGTTTPNEKLEVDGNAHITGDLTVDGNINPTAGCWRHSGAQVFSGAAPSSWTDLDLSGYVGGNHALVLMKVKGASGSSTHIFRPNGDTDEYWRCSDLSDMGAQGHKGECAEAGLVVLETDENGIIEWNGQGTNVTLTLLGYVK